MENFRKTVVFPGEYGRIGGNTAWADMAGLGSKGLKQHNAQHSGHTSQNFQNELMIEIYSKSLVRAFGKVLRMNLARIPIKKNIMLIKNGLCL